MLLLLLSLPLALCNQATTPANPFFPFEDINDPSKQCLDIFCYEPIEWSDNKREVCRYRKERDCQPRAEEVCIEVPATQCEVVGYTQCQEAEELTPLRDDKVVGEFFYEQQCEKFPIAVTELKMKPQCFNQSKTVCEKMWVKEAPYWKDVNCQDLVWENCTMVPHPHQVQIDYCQCKPIELWYNKFEEQSVDVACVSSSCIPKAVPVCKTVPTTKCVTVEWEECTEICTEDCSMQHFREPEQFADHRRWCSHVEIVLPPDVTGPPSTEAAPTSAASEQLPRGGRSDEFGGELAPNYRKPLPRSGKRGRPISHKSRGY